MNRYVITILLASQLLLPVGFSQTKPAVELEGAIAKEQVDGDLKSAIVAYQRIAADTSAPRDVRSKSLLHLAGCYEKLGRQAQTVYEQIVHDFGDQPAAVQARVRLTAIKQDNRPTVAPSMTQRKTDMPPGLTFAQPWQTDGRRLIYWEISSGELIYADLATHRKQVIYKSKTKYSSDAAYPSRDFSKVALVIPDDSKQPSQQDTLAIISNEGTGYRELAKLPIRSEARLNWSWDNRYIVCREARPGVSRLITISVANGRVLELWTQKTSAEKEANEASLGAFFSPDGRFLAYEELASDAAEPSSHIFIQSANGGSREIVSEPSQQASGQSFRILDWTSDGRYLAVTNEGAVKPALYLLSIKDGRQTGPPVFLRYGAIQNGYASAGGKLIYRAPKPGGTWRVYVAPLDPQYRPGPWKLLNLPLANMYEPMTSWSSDSNQIAYLAGDDTKTRNTQGESVHLYNLSSGEDRDIYHGLAGCIWANRQPELFCTSQKIGLFSIAAASGQITRLRPWDGTERGLVYTNYSSQDDSAVYLFMRIANGSGRLVRWEIETAKETELTPRGLNQATMSRDEPGSPVMKVANCRSVLSQGATGGAWLLLDRCPKAMTCVFASHQMETGSFSRRPVPQEN